LHRLLVLVSLTLGLLPPAFSAATDQGNSIARGEYLAAAAGCISCHTDTDNKGPAFAGGHALQTSFGVFYTPNITPDLETGIGNWSDAEFVSALREGIAPDGSHYYPSFPYPSYAGMTEEDALAIKSWLDTLEPVYRANRNSELKWFVPGRWAMGLWKWLFSPWQYPDTSADLKRGAYLVRHLGHCGECHTPRNLFGALRTGAELSGTAKTENSKGAPALANSQKGITSWELSDLTFFLEIGMTPDGDFAGSGMAAVIDDNTSKLTPTDREAIAGYLLSIRSRAD
jgi:mono/diheme cytochrome c family protein